MGLSNRTKSTPSSSDIPKTSDDMTDMCKWRFGQTLYGSQAKSSEFYKGYIRDIQRSYGMEDSYRPIYIDTNKSVSKQLKKLKRR